MSSTRFRGSLSRMFPPDDGRSPWMVRLAIIRQDLRFEIAHLGVPDEPTLDDYFRTSYFLRRISISLLEAENILGCDVGKLVKERRREFRPFRPDFVRALKKLRARVTNARPVLEQVRNVIGAHVRLNEDLEVARQVLRTHGDRNVTVHIDGNTGQDTNLHDIAMTSFLFAWPTATDDASFTEKHEEYKVALIAAVHGVIQATDVLLFMFWSELGVPATEE